MTPHELADRVAAAAADKKARDIVILDIRGRTTIADYFVICEGDTDRQVRAIVDNISEVLRERGIRPLSVAGMNDASWACIDLDAVIVHVFLPGERTYYNLEALWSAPLREHVG